MMISLKIMRYLKAMSFIKKNKRKVLAVVNNWFIVLIVDKELIKRGKEK